LLCDVTLEPGEALFEAVNAFVWHEVQGRVAGGQARSAVTRGKLRPIDSTPIGQQDA
jgi:hypothetical protein